MVQNSVIVFMGPGGQDHQYRDTAEHVYKTFCGKTDRDRYNLIDDALVNENSKFREVLERAQIEWPVCYRDMNKDGVSFFQKLTEHQA